MKRAVLGGVMAAVGALVAVVAWPSAGPQPAEVEAATELHPDDSHVHSGERADSDAPTPDAGPELHSLCVAVADDRGPAPGAKILLDGVAAPTPTDAQGDWCAALEKAPRKVGARRGHEASAPIALDGFPEKTVALTLRDSMDVSGAIVAQADGSPIEGAKVELGADALVTDHDGRFSFDAPPGRLDLTVTHAGFLDLHRQIDVDAQPVQLQLALVASVSISGSVVDRSGNPIPHAHVSGKTAHDSGNASTEADDQGKFRLDGLEVNSWALDVSAEGFETGLLLSPAPASDVRIELHRGGEIEGTVYDGEGKPCPDALVVAKPQIDIFAAKREQVFTDQAGHFDMTGVATGSLTLSASKQGMVASEPKSLSIADEAYLKVDLHLGGGGRTVRGNVVDAQSHTPIARADVSVVLSEQAKPGERPPDDVVTGPDGSFVLHNVPDDARLIGASADGHGEKKLPPADTMTFELATAMVRGRVLDAQGAPLHTFNVADVDVSSLDGRYAVPFPPDAGAIDFWKLGYLPKSVPVPAHAAGAGVDLGDVTLTQAGAVSVTVLDPEGQPDPGARVFIWEDESASYRSQIEHGNMKLAGIADASGVARFHLEPVHTCFIAFDERYPPSGTESCPHKVTEEGGSFTVRFPRPAWVHGRITDDQGQPGAAWFVASDREDITASTDANGSYRLGPLSAGSTLVIAGEVQSATYALNALTQQVKLAAGDDLELNFGHSGAAVDLEILFNDHAVSLIAGACPGPKLPEGSGIPADCKLRVTAGRGGRAVLHLDGLTPGTNTVFAGIVGHGKPTPLTLQVPAGAPAQATIDLRK